VVFYSSLLFIGRLGVEHKLQIVIAVRNLHIYPTQLLAGGAAPPELLKAKQVVIKLQRRIKRADEHADMRYVS